MLDMFHKDILPAVTAYTEDLTKAVLDKRLPASVQALKAHLPIS